MKVLFLLTGICLTLSCARTLEKDYKVVDASHQEIPEWVEDLEEYIDDEIDSEVEKKFKFYKYSSVAKNDRSIACKIANANATATIAAEISTFIEEKFKQEVDGDSSNSDKKLNEYIQNDLKKIVKANVVGAERFREYWEKRRFLKDEGASKNWDGFVCSVLYKISKTKLKRAFKRTEDAIVKTLNEDQKNSVNKALEKAMKAYLKEKESSKT